MNSKRASPILRCPGQDQRFWKPEDIFEVKCPHCGRTVEFFRDDTELNCSSCDNVIRNPRIDMSCAKWCRYGKQCLQNSGLSGM